VALKRDRRSDFDATIDLGLEILGRSVRRARAQAGLSQHHLGRLAGIHQTTVSRLETGTLGGLRLSKLAAVIGALNGFPIVDEGRHEVLCDRYARLQALRPVSRPIPPIVITEEEAV
jgi:transcriptional regulator with XRE-family HTH domain